MDEEVLIAAGPFQMGCDSNQEVQCNDDPPNESPLHTVEMPAYFIDRYEVTNARYRACVQADECTPPASTGSDLRTHYFDKAEFDEFPVIYVTWTQAGAFCAWRGQRLPTEAEWEKAARGAVDTRQYPWGDDDPTCQLANYAEESACSFGGDTQAVGSFNQGQSPYGIDDMAGNVAEWVSDWYDGSYYSQTPPDGWYNPQGPATGTERVVRGGSWFQTKSLLRVARRIARDPADVPNHVGFRCARTAE